ncbi:hypothetical protein [Mycolicibacterium hippocampi]|uniref:Low molecular weight antigen MTB12-like C-terminal domain-containing protein n=1 Tax=Mycolicibacterium hippocampi TaxID=659824 RepID=A0A7I9ZSK9_9MYCO|nr:hypothetical protein [Mycolicibacterium hippocampi]GFH03658.1 hypothetical protein MHIP_41410 [Mycolicibacterium hippocampi]
MTLKTLVTSLTAGAAAAVVVGAAAAGVTLVAGGTGTPGAPAQPAVQPVVFDVPLPAAPAPDLQAPLLSTLTALSGPGSFSGSKASYIQGGIGRIEGITADRAYNNAAAKGYFPLSFSIDGIDQNGPVATANVTATAASGVVATQPLTFVAGPSPTGWQISKQSALALVTSVG